MHISRTALLVLFLTFVGGQAYGQKWFEHYRDGITALQKGRSAEAVQCFSRAIAQRPESKAGARTYGVNFIDYFPYVYRGAAYARLGQRSAALKDLEHEQASGEVSNGSTDTKAPGLLRDLLVQVRTVNSARTLPPAETKDGSPDSLFALATSELAQGNIVRAKGLFLDVRKKRASYRGVDEQLSRVQAFDLEVRKGIGAFLNGRYAQARDILTPLAQRGRDHVNAQAFLGCSHAALFLLGGRERVALRDSATAAFRQVKRVDPTFDLHRPYVSPAIQDIYTAVSAE